MSSNGRNTMIRNENINLNKDKNDYQKIVVFLVFMAGFLNSRQYITFIGLGWLSGLMLMLFYGLLAMLVIYFILNMIYNNNLYISYLNYWGLLVGSVFIKYLILYLQFPNSFLSEGGLFSSLQVFLIGFTLMLILILGIKSIYYLKTSILFFGLGASFSAIIPLIFFPEMIGTRTTIVEEFNFTGSFWNSAVISYISVGWLLIAISTFESSKKKRYLQVGIFILLILASLAGLSRGTLISLILSLAVYLIISNGLVKYIKTLIFITLISIVGIVFFQDTIESFQQRLEGGINIEEESRTTIWMDYLEALPSYFLIGAPEGDYTKYSFTNQPPHNVLLNWLAQFGIIALIGFISLLTGFVRIINSVRKNISLHTGAALYAWLVSYLSIAMINETGFNNLTIFGAFGLVLAWGNIINKDFKKNS